MDRVASHHFAKNYCSLKKEVHLKKSKNSYKLSSLNQGHAGTNFYAHIQHILRIS